MIILKNCKVKLFKSKFHSETILRITNFKFKKEFLHINGFGIQLLNGSPVYPSRQEQIGTWLRTVHCAPTPHDPGQGSEHFSRMQASALKHSAFIVHSGLQFGGTPI